MSNYIFIGLDTTNSSIRAIVPQFVDKSKSENITIESNVPLDTDLSIFFVDSKGNRIDLQPVMSDDIVVSTLDVKDISVGEGVLYITDGTDSNKLKYRRALVVTDDLGGINQIDCVIENVLFSTIVEKVVR